MDYPYRPARVRKFDQCPDFYVYLPFIHCTKMTLSRYYNNICHHIPVEDPNTGSTLGDPKSSVKLKGTLELAG